MSNSYIDSTNFLLRAFPSGSFNSVPTGTIDLYLDSAASEVDAALRAKHKLPLSSTPEVLKDAISSIVSYRLLLHVGSRPDADDVALERRYLEITSPGGLLDRISRGQFIFDSSIDATPTTYEGSPIVQASKSNRSRGVRVFNDDGDELI